MELKIEQILEQMKIKYKSSVILKCLLQSLSLPIFLHCDLTWL